MFFAIIAIFAVAILLGMYLLTFVLTDHNPPKGVAIIHGFSAAVGLILLFIYASYTSLSYLSTAIIFIFVALGGFYMFYRDLTGKIPRWLALGHGFIAFFGFVLLICLYLGMK